MGMDVYGKNPKNERGEYFRNNVWWWRPLWRYCEHVASELIPNGNLGHSNDGWGLDAVNAEELGQRLLLLIAEGKTKQHEDEYMAALKALPLEPCEICAGTGKRKEPPQSGAGNIHCNGCDGKGKRESFAAHYPFSTDNVREFAEFCISSGGFKIC
jgi:hypothetical protein